jgi:uncharacterized protein (TIGR03083 family)
MSITAGQHYHAIRTRLAALAGDLSPEQAATPVPALPGWSVQDTYAHLAGVGADIVAGDGDKPHPPAWNAIHIAERKDLSLAEICAEWAGTGPDAEAVLDSPAGRNAMFTVVDAFHHSQDIFGALGLSKGRETPEAAFAVSYMTNMLGYSWGRSGRPPIDLKSDAGSWRFGAPEAEPFATLTTSDFELARILIGRRSHAQMLAAGWTGDPGPIVGMLPMFRPPVTDLTE